MSGFVIIYADLQIRFRFYAEEAPATVNAFVAELPFTREFMHARVSGQEIWTDKGLGLNIIQENASVFTIPGEVVLGPLRPKRTRTSDCIGIYYGEGTGLDCCNIFAKVFDEDMSLLIQLGEEIWKKGLRALKFEEYD
jgi:hypothetical protein